MRNHKGSLWKYEYRELFCVFRPLIFTYFRPFGIVMRTSDQTRPETLLAAVNTFFTDMVILPPAVLTQEERPFQTPFLAPAHKSPSSGGFFLFFMADKKRNSKILHIDFTSSRCRVSVGQHCKYNISLVIPEVQTVLRSISKLLF